MQALRRSLSAKSLKSFLKPRWNLERVSVALDNPSVVSALVGISCPRHGLKSPVAPPSLCGVVGDRSEISVNQKVATIQPLRTAADVLLSIHQSMHLQPTAFLARMAGWREAARIRESLCSPCGPAARSATC